MVICFVSQLFPHQHRDIKPENILINSEIEIKFCDFGLARGVTLDNPKMSTTELATRYYRSPELCLMWEQAGKEMDVWSVGCVFAELLNREILFKGKDELDQLKQILNVLGTP